MMTNSTSHQSDTDQRNNIEANGVSIQSGCRHNGLVRDRKDSGNNTIHVKAVNTKRKRTRETPDEAFKCSDSPADGQPHEEERPMTSTNHAGPKSDVSATDLSRFD